VSQIHNNFVQWVTQRRGQKITDDSVFSGRVFVGRKMLWMWDLLMESPPSLNLMNEKFSDRENLRLMEVKKKADDLGLLGLLSGFLRWRLHVD
jgi:hypothetical protein